MRMGRAARLPVVATLMTAIAVPAMLGLGAWQLQRRHWKEAQLATLASAMRLPPLIVPGALPPGLQFRRITATLSCPAAAPALRAGQSVAGAAGYAVGIGCAAGAEPVELIVAFVDPEALRPASAPTPAFTAAITGRLVETNAATPRYRFYADAVPAPLAGRFTRPAAAPTLDSIPNNHLSYAIQWFSFATIWLGIYAVFAAQHGRRFAKPSPTP